MSTSFFPLVEKEGTHENRDETNRVSRSRKKPLTERASRRSRRISHVDGEADRDDGTTPSENLNETEVLEVLFMGYQPGEETDALPVVWNSRSATANMYLKPVIGDGQRITFIPYDGLACYKRVCSGFILDQEWDGKAFLDVDQNRFEIYTMLDETRLRIEFGSKDIWRFKRLFEISGISETLCTTVSLNQTDFRQQYALSSRDAVSEYANRAQVDARVETSRR